MTKALLVSAAAAASSEPIQIIEEEKKHELIAVQRNTEEEEEKSAHIEEQNWVINWDPVYYRYSVGNHLSSEFGLQRDGKNEKIEIKHQRGTSIFFDDRCYNTKHNYRDLNRYGPFEFVHKSLGWVVKIGCTYDLNHTLEVNGVKY